MTRLTTLGSVLLLLSLTACEENRNVFEAPSDTTPGATGPLPDAGIDTDGDGLDDRDELLGWEIAVDALGFGPDSGLLTVQTVTSDPMVADTDGDGLDDLEEFLARTDPSNDDTDGDLLTDAEELRRWGTSPTSIDTDGDATGPAGTSAPDQALFDGAEVRETKTSPRLADTDGDGWTDFQEIRDNARHPLLAELPQAQIEFAGELEMFLNVEYEESLGVEERYGSSFGTEMSVTSSVSYENQIGVEIGAAFSIAAEGGFPTGTKATKTLEGHINVGYSHTWTKSQESSTTTAEEYSRYVTDSQTRTESVASGTVTIGVEVANVGSSTFGLEELALALLFYNPDALSGSEEFRTLATLLPQSTGLVLAPGERSAVIQFEASDVNADLMKELLARPASIVLQPTSFGLTDAAGVDFDFITEGSNSRTSIVDIRFGPEEFATYFVASSVGRDESGNPTGIRLQDVLEILGYERGVDYTTQEQSIPDDNGVLVNSGIEILTSLDGRETIEATADRVFPLAFWIVGRNSPDESRVFTELPGFDDITLLPGEEMQLIYAFDSDDDGLSDSLEDFFATGPEDSDSDEDGLTDRDELVMGWEVGLDPATGSVVPELVQYGYPKMVFTDALQVDTDQDGLTDPEELALGTDPTHPDTDRDNVTDGTDECPLMASRVLYVWPDRVPTGTGWDEAYDSLLDALEAARMMNDQDSCLTAVSEIWVARGTYYADGGVNDEPGDSSQALLLQGDPIGIYGGFLGGELKRGQRDANPLTNGTILSGDVSRNDDPADPGTLDDNRRVLVATLSRGAESPYVLDGFQLESGVGTFAQRGGALSMAEAGDPRESPARIEIRNCFFVRNQSGTGGALGLEPGVDALIEDCLFVSNEADVGGAIDATGADCTLQGTQFQANTATLGGAVSFSNNYFEVDDCFFSQNLASEGGGFRSDTGSGSVSNTLFVQNESEANGGGVQLRGGDVTFVQCSFLENRTLERETRGSAVDVRELPVGRSSLINCTIARNVTAATNISPYGAVWNAGTLENCVLHSNVRRANLFGGTAIEDVRDEAAQLSRSSSVRHCAIASLGAQALGPNPNIVPGEPAPPAWPGAIGLYGAANLNNFSTIADTFADPSGRLAEGSPCIDRGFNFVDIDPLTPGIQLLPETDLGGHGRILDGNGDGISTVDVGAYEFVGQ